MGRGNGDLGGWDDILIRGIIWNVRTGIRTDTASELVECYWMILCMLDYLLSLANAVIYFAVFLVVLTIHAHTMA